MPEQSAMHLLGRLRLARQSRRIAWPLACALPLFGITATAFAQSVPPTLRACAAETDAGQRLDCYDREMARLLAPTKQPAAAATRPDLPASTTPMQPSGTPPEPASGPAAAPAPGPAATPGPSPAAPSVSSASPMSAPPSTAAATSADAAPASGVTSASHRSSWKNILSGGPAWHVTAHVASLDRSPDSLVLHLDNGQAWRQIARTSGDLSLRAGDSVTIEKHLGSYWLSSRYVSNMQVRLEPQQSQ